jgi:hypothetical protein
MLGRVRSVVASISVPFFLALIALCLVLVANMVTQSLLPAPLLYQVRKAFLAGDLPPTTIQDLDRQRGALLYNDCLILGMALNRDPSLGLRIVSPALFESPTDEAMNKDACAILHDVVIGRNSESYRGLPYHRYIAGFVPLAAAIVPGHGVAAYKQTLLILNYTALLALIAAGLVAAAKAMRKGEPPPFYLWAFPLIIAVFGGVEFYAQNLSIGLADLGLYGLIAVLFYSRPEEWPLPGLAIIASAFGVYIGMFEFFTGQIPVMLALPVALLAMRARNDFELRRAIATGLQFAAYAVLGILFLFAEKIVLAVLLGGLDVVTNFSNQLALRIGDGAFGIGKMVLYMAGRADRIGQGSVALGLAYAASATISGFVGLVYLGRRGGFPFHRALTIVASMAVIIVWHIVFRNHSTIHSEFMVRSTSFVFASGWIIGGFALCAWLAERASCSALNTSSALGGPSRPR